MRAMVQRVIWLSAGLILAADGGVGGHGWLAKAGEVHGAFGKRAAEFLVRQMPEEDKRSLSEEFLMENLDLAMKARETFPWAKSVPEEMFFNDVLPYAVFDEPRDPWRRRFFELAGELVKDAKSASEAALILNRDLFDRVRTHYDTGRERANQSPAESMRQGKASCTGLSIILVCACRSVGIPARAVGTPLWWNDSGNHTWVEIWDDGWHFMGADEHDEQGLDRGWFVKNAAKADAGDVRRAIYATSWDRSGGWFPLVWAPRSRAVGAVNVTGRYAGAKQAEGLTIGVRLMSDGKRVATKGWLTKVSGYPLEEFHTKAGQADQNDTPRVMVRDGERYRWKFLIGSDWKESEVFRVAEGGKDLHDVSVDGLRAVPDFKQHASGLSKEMSRRAMAYAHDELVAERLDGMKAEMAAKTIEMDGMKMRWMENTFGDEPVGGRSLWISMHGGGEAPQRVNDQQWQNQIRLYEPDEGIYVAPRAPTDKWNMWHQAHIDPMFGRLIELMVVLRGVNPDKVYLTGYSAGGDGVWQVAPRMADRFAAAAMMAGHPNEARLDGLRNLPFAIFMGAEDHAVNRAAVAVERSRQMADLHKADPEGYVHLSRIYEGLGHWMNRRDAEGIPWMAKFTRNPWPSKIVWYQDDVTHKRFYWLDLPEGCAEKGQRITASVQDRVIRLGGDVPKGMRILLSDEMLDLDEPIEVRVEGKAAFQAQPKRSYHVIREALAERLDLRSVPVAVVEVP